MDMLLGTEHPEVLGEGLGLTFGFHFSVNPGS